MIKNEKIIIVGHTGSGKSYLLREISKKGLTACLKTTTRPIRKLEVDGVDYRFISDESFTNEVENNKLLFHESFRVKPEGSNEEQLWYYGITKEEFESAQIFIMTPGEFNNIPTEYRKMCFVVYLDISRDVRESRLHIREDRNDSIKRRLDSDDIDFKYFIDYDLKITDPDFSPDDIYDLMS